MALSKEELMEAIKGMSVLEMVELVKALEEEFGVSAAAPVMAAPTGATGASAAAAEEEEKTEFTVVLKEIGENKINVIKAVREITQLGLREAKELVDSAPKQVSEAIAKNDAEQMKQKLEAAGATVSLE